MILWMKPDARLHNPDPARLRSLIEAAGLTQREAAKRIGISERQMRSHLADPATASTAAPAPYPTQFALEALARDPIRLVIELLKSELTAEELAAADAGTRKRLATLCQQWASLARPLGKG